MLKANKFVRALVASALVAGTLVSLLPTAASAAAVSAVSVTTGSTIGGATSSYVITFTTATVVAAGGKIKFTFPTGTTIPASGAFATTPPTFTGGAGLAMTSTVSDATARTVTITSVSAQSAAGSVVITLPSGIGIKNPKGGSHTLTVETFASNDAANDTAGTSSAYLIYGITSASSSPNTPGAVAGITVVMYSSAVLTAGVSTITVTFPTATNNTATTTGFTLPTSIAKAAVVINGSTAGGNGTQVTSTQSPAADPIVDLSAGTVQFTVPDMNPASTGTAGHDLAAGSINLVFGSSAGIVNPIANSSSAYTFATRSTGDTATVGTAPATIPRVLLLSNVRGARGTTVTVTGLGFGGSSAFVFLDNVGPNNAIRTTDEPILADNVAVSGGKFTATIVIGGGFTNGGNNFIQALDATGLPASAVRAVATNYNLVASVLSMTPVSGKIGDLVTLQLQDFPAGAVCRSLTSANVAQSGITVGGVSVDCFEGVAGGAPNAVSSGTIGADGTATWSLLVPSGVTQGAANFTLYASTSVGTATQTDYSATKAFTVDGAKLTITPSTVVAGQKVTVSGTGFTGSTNLVLAAASSGINGVTIGGAAFGTTVAPNAPNTQSDSGGSMVMQFTMPKVTTNGFSAITAPGQYTVAVTDGTISGSAVLTVGTPVLTLTPTTGLGGSTISFIGTNMPAETSVTVTYPATSSANNVTATVQTDTNGGYSGTMTIPSSSNLAIPSSNTVTASALSGVVTVSALHTIPAAGLTVSPSSGAPGTPLTIKGTNFPIFTSLTTLNIGGNNQAVTGVNTDASGNFTMTTLIPGLNPGTQAVVATVSTTTANTSLTVNTQPATVSAVSALGALVNTQNLNIVTSFDYKSATYTSYVPGLAGNSLVAVSPNSVIFVNMTKATVVIVSGISFSLAANVPTPLPVGAAVTIGVQ